MATLTVRAFRPEMKEETDPFIRRFSPVLEETTIQVTADPSDLFTQRTGMVGLQAKLQGAARALQRVIEQDGFPAEYVEIRVHFDFASAYRSAETGESSP